MRVTEIRKPGRITFPTAPDETLNPEVPENTQDILHWVRSQVYGQCPQCKGTHNKQMQGWNRMQCQNCGTTWSY
jgi:hypothetical protein